ncbi:MAG: 3-isopropylmalate dehydratase large subunit [Planctomycetes bacterium]|nr:3-isopropylmalate dehydratase large subunit [Planctomycetota bacterium]
MGKTIVEKILGNHAGRDVKPGDIVDVTIDARVARDFGGANVVKNIRDNSLSVADPKKTFFTFDCNPGGSDQRYAENQQLCRLFAREQGVEICDINAGIGTHLAIERGLVGPGETFVSTDSHANILGAIGAFGQGMGDQDIAHAFAFGTVWFKVPPTVRVRLEGRPSKTATPKDVTLALCKHFCANGLLGYAAELYGPYVDQLDMAGRVTVASMCTEMGGIVLLFPPNQAVLDFCQEATGRKATAVQADPDAEYVDDVTVNIDGLKPLVARPGHPDDVIPASEVTGTKVDSVFIGSCTNGRYEDLVAAARVLKGRRIAPGVVLKIVPATDEVWQQLLNEGVVKTFKDAGALIGNAGCAGCAAGQIGQNGPGEGTVSTGNRNFPGKQGKGSVYLASPETAAASAVAGVIATADAIPAEPVRFAQPKPAKEITAARAEARGSSVERHTKIKGRVWRIAQDNIDTDMIYHNRYLTITDPAEMGQYTFDNLEGWEDFAKKVKPGDIVVTGKNFGCGSSRQQAVDCFKTLGVAAIVAESFGAIYERNAINAGLAIMSAPAIASVQDGDEVEVDFETTKCWRC